MSIIKDALIKFKTKKFWTSVKYKEEVVGDGVYAEKVKTGIPDKITKHYEEIILPASEIKSFRTYNNSYFINEYEVESEVFDKILQKWDIIYDI